MQENNFTVPWTLKENSIVNPGREEYKVENWSFRFWVLVLSFLMMATISQRVLEMPYHTNQNQNSLKENIKGVHRAFSRKRAPDHLSSGTHGSQWAPSPPWIPQLRHNPATAALHTQLIQRPLAVSSSSTKWEQIYNKIIINENFWRFGKKNKISFTKFLLFCFSFYSYDRSPQLYKAADFSCNEIYIKLCSHIKGYFHVYLPTTRVIKHKQVHFVDVDTLAACQS